MTQPPRISFRQRRQRIFRRAAHFDNADREYPDKRRTLTARRQENVLAHNAFDARAKKKRLGAPFNSDPLRITPIIPTTRRQEYPDERRTSTERRQECPDKRRTSTAHRQENIFAQNAFDVRARNKRTTTSHFRRKRPNESIIRFPFCRERFDAHGNTRVFRDKRLFEWHIFFGAPPRKFRGGALRVLFLPQ